MTKARPDTRPPHGKKDLFSDLAGLKPAAGKIDAPVEPGLLQRIVVAGFHALATHRTRRALEGLELVRLRDIGLEPSDIERAVKDTADQASEAFARRLDRRWRTADQGDGTLHAAIECLVHAGRMQR